MHIRFLAFLVISFGCASEFDTTTTETASEVTPDEEVFNGDAGPSPDDFDEVASLAATPFQVGEDVQHPLPVQIEHDDAMVEANMVAWAAEQAQYTDPHVRVGAFLSAVDNYLVVAASPQHDSWFRDDGTVYLTTWTIEQVLAGNAVGSAVVLEQPTLFARKRPAIPG